MKQDIAEQAYMLRPKQAAAFLGLNVSTVYRMAQDGRLPRPIKITDRASGWRREDLQEYIDRQEQASRGAA